MRYSTDSGAYSAICSTELSATSTAHSSACPPARSFHSSTIAMQRASPTMITPDRNAGRSGRHAHARPVMRAGPSTQLSKKLILK